MNKKQMVSFLFIVLSLGVVLFFTFSYFKNEEEKYIENAKQNRRLEKEEREKMEEKEKQENGKKEVDVFLEKLKETKKIVLGIEDINGKMEVLDATHHYREVKTIVEEPTIQEILNVFVTAKWEENKNVNDEGKIWQFYNNENNLILEYDGYSFVTKDTITNIFIPKENKEILNQYFVEV